jgi:hypothetical protein
MVLHNTIGLIRLRGGTIDEFFTNTVTNIRVPQKAKDNLDQLIEDWFFKTGVPIFSQNI